MTRKEAIKRLKEIDIRAYAKELDKIYKPIEFNVLKEPCEDIERKIEKEYLFESLCEDLKKLQAENDNLRNALEQEHILDKIRAEIEQTANEEQKHDEKWAIGLRYAIKIIDKYMERRDKE